MLPAQAPIPIYAAIANQVGFITTIKLIGKKIPENEKVPGTISEIISINALPQLLKTIIVADFAT